MIIIKHRINSIQQIKNTPIKYGVEIDLRSNKKFIYLHHDPFRNGVKFKNWVKNYNHKLLVLNVKEEGLEEKILEILKKNNINNFFFHDQTFSTLLKNMKKTKTSIRFSEYEDIKRKKTIFKYIKWIWIDYFSKFSLNKSFYNFLKKNKVKICIVSPELVNKKKLNKNLFNLKKILKENKFLVDAVCTKNAYFWEK